MAELARRTRDGRAVRTRAGIVIIVALAWAAGAVNATGYLMLGDVFTSHMTGNTSALALTVVAGRGAHAIARLLALVGFFGGALTGALLVETHREHNSAAALWLESALLVAAMLMVSRAAPRGLELAVIAAAMGVQNIALAGSALSAHTTHITGPLTDFAGTAVRRLLRRRELERDRTHGLMVYGGRVCAFAGGIASGAGLFDAFGPAALVGPAVVSALIGWVVYSAAPPRSTASSTRPAES